MTTRIRETEVSIPDGTLPGRALATNADILPSQMQLQSNKELSVPFTDLRVWDAMHTLLPAAGANDDLGLVTGTPGTDAPQVSTGDVKALGATSRKAAFEYVVPTNWADGESLELIIRAGMSSAVADTSAQLSIAAYRPDGDGAVGSDINQTSAQNMNSATAADFTFALDPASVDPGDRILIVVTIAINDGATASPVIGLIYDIRRNLDLRG